MAGRRFYGQVLSLIAGQDGGEERVPTRVGVRRQGFLLTRVSANTAQATVDQACHGKTTRIREETERAINSGKENAPSTSTAAVFLNRSHTSETINVFFCFARRVDHRPITQKSTTRCQYSDHYPAPCHALPGTSLVSTVCHPAPTCSARARSPSSLQMGWAMVTSFVPSGNVPSTCTSLSSAATPAITYLVSHTTWK